MKTLRIATVLLACLFVSGCNQYLEMAINAAAKVAVALDAVAETAQGVCSDLAGIEYQAEAAVTQVGGGCTSWHASVVKVRKGSEAFCSNLSKLNDNVIGNYAVSVGKQLQTLKNTKPPGC